MAKGIKQSLNIDDEWSSFISGNYEEESDNEDNFSKNSELLRLKQEILYLKEELNSYRNININSEHESSSINLEIKISQAKIKKYPIKT
jgi:hypothetical protein